MLHLSAIAENLATKNYHHLEISIADFDLIETHSNNRWTKGKGDYHLHVFKVLHIQSTHSAEECRKLLRAVINTWINLQLYQRGIIFNKKKVRKEIIEHHIMADYKWHYLLEDMAHLFHRFEGRNLIKAQYNLGDDKWLRFS